ncbi:diguanylate cyclase [Wenzhouxiangella sp. AB-CW3]|uniref:diguanylate cyclase n=1 Tax=Wenzhouxiangella sp. AB-CW3 TaxID=2771012 RepID=UPI00168BB553|nr:diguanylate cyclase [Wenzhouxiangella sp. AB-CW3]QOC21411.1 diguanylate cyclase [Wenzhouxiangella sp. AB-CW3]
MRALIVDHSRVFRAIWQRLAAQAGHEPMMVESAASGLALLKRQPADVVCVSRSLPDGDGIEFARQARQLPHGKSVPIILLTSSTDKRIHRRAFEAGITDIHARTRIEELFKRIDRFTRERDQPLTGRVLYVEDSVTASRIMIHVMHKMSLDVDHFRSAAEALEAFDPERHDLVISDILVEGAISGITLVSRLREKHPDKTELPILAMSGMEDDARRVELFRLGVNDFISKPVIMEEARARIGNLVVNKQLFERVKKQRKQLYELAMTDALTGLYNRNSLSEFGSKLESSAHRRDMPLSIILIDIDHFKTINDRHGHLVGDYVLREIGEMLAASCREEDLAVRFGGEELLLVLPWCPLADASRRAEQLRERFETLEPAGIPVTASFGVSALEAGRTSSLESVINAADQAVYIAKSSGRNQVVTLTLAEARAREASNDNDGVFFIDDEQSNRA